MTGDKLSRLGDASVTYKSLIFKKNNDGNLVNVESGYADALTYSGKKQQRANGAFGRRFAFGNLRAGEPAGSCLPGSDVRPAR